MNPPTVLHKKKCNSSAEFRDLRDLGVEGGSATSFHSTCLGREGWVEERVVAKHTG